MIALEELSREPAAAIYARAHAGRDPSEDEALFRTVLLDLLIRVAEACGGFDWDDESFDRAYDALEQSLFGDRRAYIAVAPLVGITAGLQRVLSEGIRVRPVADGELARHWPEAKGLLPPGFGSEPDRYCVVEFRVGLDAGEDVPDAPAEIADVVSRGPARDGRPARRGTGALRDARRSAVRHPTRPADRGDAAARRGHEAGRVPRCPRCRAPRPDGARRRGHEPRRGTRPLGALAVPARAVPVGAAARRARGGPGHDVAAARVHPARDRARGSRQAARRARGPRGRRGRDTRSGRRRPARARRGPSARATVRPSSRASTASCSGSARRASASRSANRRRPAARPRSRGRLTPHIRRFALRDALARRADTEQLAVEARDEGRTVARAEGPRRVRAGAAAPPLGCRGLTAREARESSSCSLARASGSVSNRMDARGRGR